MMKIYRYLPKTINPLLILMIVSSALLIVDIQPSYAWTAPTLDGKLDDVYRQYGSITRYGDTNTHEATGLDYHPAAYLYVLEDANFVYVFYHQDIFYANDNSYGDNSIHWEARKNGIRNFADIWESDMGEFTFKDANGTVVAHFYVDQLAEDASTPSGYACGGFGPNTPDNSPWNDGLWLEGETINKDYFDIKSVMDYNLNSTGYCTGGTCTCGDPPGVNLLLNSPAADDTYQVLDEGCSDWQWYNGWEMVVDKQIFGALGFGVVIGNHHNSPTKTCTNKQKCETELILPWSTIGDRVWHDLDGDGIQDSGEPGLMGVAVELIDPRDGSLLERQITDSNGEYVFEMLSHFYYIVQVDESTLPTGFASTTLDQVDDDFHEEYTNVICEDFCIQRDGATYTRIYYVPLDHPQDYLAADFGYRPPGAVIGDYVWSDADNDGLQDLGEPGIYDVEVELLDGNGDSLDPVVTTTTDEAGWYMFTDLDPGDYKVRVLDSNFDTDGPLDGYVYSPGAESSPSPTNTITLAANEAYVNADFGYYKSGLGSIGDYIWFDANNNGFFFYEGVDEEESPAVGVTLALYLDNNEDGYLDSGDTVISTGITNSSGMYSFAGLELDQHYLVKVTDSEGVLDGYTITTYWGDDDVPEVDPLDLDRYNDPAPVYLTGSEPNVTWVDFGYNRPGTIGDTVFYDSYPHNGIQDPGEIGVYEVTVDLTGEENATTTTSYEGKYLFTERPSGDYEVEITVPTGYTISPGTVTLKGNPHSLSITGNQSYLDADFGIYRTSGDAFTIGDLIWYDTDNDGERDVTEPGIENVTVALYLDDDEDGELDPTEPLIHSMATDITGAYTFYGLLADYYIVDVTDENNVLSGYTLTEGELDADNYSHVDPYGVHVTGDVTKVDFGYYYETTLAALSSFSAFQQNGHVVLEWETNSEVGTVGFILYRQDVEGGAFEQVNEGLLPGLLHSPQGGSYQFLDRGAIPGEIYTYKLVEIDYEGAQHRLGTFTRDTSEASSGVHNVSETRPYWKNAHALESLHSSPTSVPGEGSEYVEAPATVGGYQVFIPLVISNGNPTEAPVGKPVKVSVREDGLYRLSTEDIASEMDVSTSVVENLINDQELQVLHKGEQISYLPLDGNAGIYFYGEAIESIYTNENVYWLIQGNGETVASIIGEGPDPLFDEESFTQVHHFEEDHYALTALFDDPESDYWLWDYFIAGTEDASKTFTFRTDGATGSGSATLDLYLHGATDIEVNPDHHVIVRLVVGGVTHELGESWWNGKDFHHFQTSFDSDLLTDGDNSLQVVAALDSGVSYSIFYLDSFTITYERYLRAVNDSLIFPGQDLPVVTVRDFTSPEIFVFDITNPQEPILMTATTVSSQCENFSVSFGPGSGEKEFLAVSLNGLSDPDSLVMDVASNLKSGSNTASYLVITVDNLMAAAQSLQTYRQGQGLSTMAVDLQDIYDEFNYGIANPEAIKDFLDYATSNWATPPGNVVLFGTGTFDYKDNQGFGDNLVPTVLVSGLGGLFASDTYFADVLNNDGIPDFAIGRLPVLNSTEAANVITKITAFESINPNPWMQNVIMLADNPDLVGDFPADSDDLAATIPFGYNIDKIYLPEPEPPSEEITPEELDEARTQLMDGINAGAGFMNYIGHAGLNSLTTEGLLVSADMALLTNDPMFPIMTAMTCVAGRFELPGHVVLGEAMILDNDGGMIAVWAPSGLSINEEARALDNFFIQAIFNDGATTLGEAILSAFHDYAEGDHMRYMLEVYNLLGDPALVIGWNQ